MFVEKTQLTKNSKTGQKQELISWLILLDDFLCGSNSIRQRDP